MLRENKAIRLFASRREGEQKDPPRFIGPSTKATYIPVSASTDFPQLFEITATSLHSIIYYILSFSIVMTSIAHGTIKFYATSYLITGFIFFDL